MEINKCPICGKPNTRGGNSKYCSGDCRLRANQILPGRKEDKRIGKIKRLLEQGLKYREIGEKLGTSKQRIHQLAKKHGLTKGSFWVKETIQDSVETDGAKRNRYYCKRCKNYFRSKLPLEEAICVKCGSDKIIE